MMQVMTRHVEHCMGTVFSIAIADAGDWQPAIAEITEWLHHVDRTFSTYRDDSEISKLRRGDSCEDPLVAEVLDMCADYEARTDGAFTANLPGGLDPSGLVKGWSIERASWILRSHGSTNHAVSGGGDMQLAGEAEPGRPWRVGISDPFERTKVIATVSGRDLAVATSGTAERGTHIIDPRTGRAADGLTSVSIVGPLLTWVDVAATAAFTMGAQAIDWIEQQAELEGLVITAEGQARQTSGFASLS